MDFTDGIGEINIRKIKVEVVFVDLKVKIYEAEVEVLIVMEQV